MPITYPCPRADLDCAAAFATAGDLDWHLRLAHGYGPVYRIWTSLRPPRPLGPPPPRHVPDGLVEGPGTLTTAERHAADERHAAQNSPAGQDPLTGMRPSATVSATTSHRRLRRHVRISR